MAQVAGITVERTARGHLMYARIDLRKHAKFIPMLKEMGIEEKSPYDRKFVEKIKSQEGMSAVKIKTEDIWK